jgi:hypothetical protein
MNLLSSIDEKHNRGMQEINNKLKVYENNFTNLRNKLDELVTSFNNLQKENNLLKSELNYLRDGVKLINFVDQNNIDLVNEVNERLSRSRNIIIFNSEDDIISDEAIVNDLIYNMKVNVPIAKIQRIGNLSSKNLPLRITFNDTSDVTTILKSKSKLRNTDKYKNLWINSDLTNYQREQMKYFCHELQQKKNSGERNWIIKYVHVVPTLFRKTDSDRAK